jgi:hypothetical protein
MTKMKLFFLVTILLSGISVYAQKPVGGEIAIGARFGGVSALDIKKYNGYNTSALEFIAGWNFDNNVDGFTVTAFWEKLAPLSGSKQLSAIIGLGPTMAFGNEFRLGASGIIGADWRFKMLPLNLQFDWSPTWFFVNGSDFSWVNGAVSVRYIINNNRGRK